MMDYWAVSAYRKDHPDKKAILDKKFEDDKTHMLLGSILTQLKKMSPSSPVGTRTNLQAHVAGH